MVMMTHSPQGSRLNPQNTIELSQGMSIQTAIDTADAHGGNWTIILYPGADYDEGDLTPSGAANITIRGMGEDRVTIAPTVAPTTAVIVSGGTLTLEKIRVVAPDATRPVLTVTGGNFLATRSHLVGVAGGDSINIAGGVAYFYFVIFVGNLRLMTNPTNTRFITSRIESGDFITQDAVAHTIEMIRVDFESNDLVSNATGACAYDIQDCNDIGNLTDASLAGNGRISRCDVTGVFTKTGTTNWIIDNCEVYSISNTNAVGGIIMWWGTTFNIIRAIGSIVWWMDVNTLKVLPCTTITDTIIQWAVAAAGAGDTVVIHPGTYEEAVVLAAGINLKGLDKESCIINIDHAVLITMAAGCSVSGLTLDVTCDATGSGTGIELNDAACTIEDVNIVLHRPAAGAYATGILESTGATARAIHIRNVRCTMSDNTNERGIAIEQAGRLWLGDRGEWGSCYCQHYLLT